MIAESTLIVLFGSCTSILLGVNAFFTRQTLQAITDVRLEVAKLLVRHDATEERSKRNESEIRFLRDRMHSVEGGQKSVIPLLEMYDEELKELKKRINNQNS